MKTKTLLLSSLAMCAGLAQTPAIAQPPPWAPAHGYRAQHKYIYYPVREVYYAPETRTWFWLNGGNWQLGASLPNAYVPYVRSGGVPIALESHVPYDHHRYVVEHHGKHHKHKKHKHKHRKRADDDDDDD